MRQNKRYRYGIKTDRFKQQQQLICRQLPNKDAFSSNELIYYLQSQGYHLDTNELAKISDKLFGRNEDLSMHQMIGIAARLAVDDQLQRQMKKIFYFFSGGEDLLTAQQLKSGMERLGQGLKERQINQILIDIDLNSNGYIDFQTFLQAMLIQ